MSKGDIDRWNVSLSGDLPLHDLDDAYVDVPDRPVMFKKKKNFWKDTAFGRTLSLRNKTGKTLLGVLTGGVGLLTGIDVGPITEAITGVNKMEALADLGLLELLIGLLSILVTGAVTWAKSYWKLPKAFVSKIILFIEVLSEELVEATRKESEGGSKITRNERRQIAYSTFKEVFGSSPDELKDLK